MLAKINHSKHSHIIKQKLKEKRVTYMTATKNFHFKKRGMIYLDLNFLERREGNT